MMSFGNDQLKYEIWNPLALSSSVSHWRVKGFSSKRTALRSDVAEPECILYTVYKLVNVYWVQAILMFLCRRGQSHKGFSSKRTALRVDVTEPECIHSTERPWWCYRTRVYTQHWEQMLQTECIHSIESRCYRQNVYTALRADVTDRVYTQHWEQMLQTECIHSIESRCYRQNVYTALTVDVIEPECIHSIDSRCYRQNVYTALTVDVIEPECIHSIDSRCYRTRMYTQHWQ